MLLFIPFLGQSHLFDWDEINFAEAAREMIVTGDYLRVQINFQMFWEKPPFFIWLQVLSMKVFGINEFAARFPNALLGVISANLLLFLGRKLKDQFFGLIWVSCYLCSTLPLLYFKSGIIDPWFNTFIFFGIILYYLGLNRNRILYPLLSGISIGLAVLTKGPVALLIYGLVIAIYHLINWKRESINIKYAIIIALSTITIPGLWFLYDYINNGSDYIVDFVLYQIDLFKQPGAGHQQPFYYHFLVILIGCFPMSAFIFNCIKTKQLSQLEHGKLLQLSWITFLTVLILFTIVETKIVHYSSLCYLPLSYIISHYLYHQLKQGIHHRFNWNYFLIIGCILSFALIGLVYFMASPEIWDDYISDEWARLKMKDNPNWYYWELLFGLILLLSTILAYLYSRINNKKAFFIAFYSNAIIIALTIFQFAPKIEIMSQGTYIDLLQSVNQNDNYIQILGAKSYAQYFYTKKAPSADQIELLPAKERKHHLLTKPINKDVYFICPSKKAAHFQSNFHLEIFEQANAWTVLKRAKTN
jgi:4-amino-4-deoxy-L-arabinose transferase-like glycosyltransferase